MSKGGSYDITGVTPTIATSFVTDAGTAIPALNILKIVGGEGVDISGAGNTVTVTGETATVANKGILELTSDAEAIDGTDGNKAIVSTSLKAKLGTQTDHGVLIGSGTTGAITALTAASNGQVLLGSGGLDPTFANLTSTDGTITFTEGAGTLNLSVGGVSQANMIYVGKFGNDVNDGRSIDKAKLTIQAGETAANAGDTIIVYPGTYTETVTHSKSNITMIAEGKTNNVIITQADANVINFGAYTGIQYKYFGISCTAATSAINTVQGSTGGCTFKECHLTMTCATDIAAVVQPAVGSITGAGDLKVTIGKVFYYHTGAGGATAQKGAFRVADGGTITLQRINDLTITNSGTALVTAVGIDTASTGVFKMNDNKITVTDPNATIVAGFVALGGTGTTHEYFRNTVHVIATNNAGYGFWSGDTASVSRFMYNHIHVEDTAGASYSFLVGNGATVISQFDDVVADDGFSIAGTGVFRDVSSLNDGQLNLTSTGTVKTTTDVLTIANTANAVDMDATGTAVLFRQKAYNATTPLHYDSGRISVVTEQDWTTADTNSRDSYMSFQTAFNGTVAEAFRAVSTKQLSFTGTENIRRGIGWLFDESTGDAFGIEQINAAMATGANPALRLFTSNAFTSEIIFGRYTDTATWVDYATFLNSGNFGVGTIVPSSLVDIERAGGAKVVTDLLEITNTYNNADMDGTGVGILFNLWYSDATPAVWPGGAGRISVISENDALIGVATQDSSMSFQTALNGTVAPKMTISGAGNIQLTVNNTGFYTTNVAGNPSAHFFQFGDDNLYLDNPDGDEVFRTGASIERVRISAAGLTTHTLIGTAKANTDLIAITNSVSAADMDGTSTGIIFNQYAYDAATPTVEDAGRIAVVTETDWVSGTVASQDSMMQFSTALDGTVAAKMTVASDGQVGIGTTAPTAEMKLHILETTAINSFIMVENTGAGQSGLRLLAGTGATNRATRIDFLNGVASTADPRWTLINDQAQTAVNDLSLFNAAGVASIIFLQSGGIAYTPAAVQNIVAATGITAAMLKPIIEIQSNTAGDADITANPQIVAGLHGQIIEFIGQDDTKTVTFDTGNGLKLEGGASFTMGLGDSLKLIYSTSLTLWIESSRSNNT